MRQDLWTAERTEKLSELHAQGLSGSRIAAILGTTKDSVISKLDRMRSRKVPKPRSSFWTDAKNHELEHLHRRGLSGSQIAGLIGTTKDAVINRLYRLKIARGLKPAPVRKRDRDRVAKATTAARAQPPREYGSLLLNDLGSNDCRFPTEDRRWEAQRHRFCGRPSAPGYRYCAQHCLEAFTFHQNPSERTKLQRLCQDMGGAL